MSAEHELASTEDQSHLDLLVIFHYIVGGMTALFSCMFLFHIAMGIAMLSGVFDGKEAPPKIFAWLFILVPGIIMLIGWALGTAIILAGRRLKRRISYTFCLVVAALECCIMPFGTVLGIFTIIMLKKDGVKRLFAG